MNGRGEKVARNAAAIYGKIKRCKSLIVARGGAGREGEAGRRGTSVPKACEQPVDFFLFINIFCAIRILYFELCAESAREWLYVVICTFVIMPYLVCVCVASVLGAAAASASARPRDTLCSSNNSNIFKLMVTTNGIRNSTQSNRATLATALTRAEHECETL